MARFKPVPSSKLKKYSVSQLEKRHKGLGKAVTKSLRKDRKTGRKLSGRTKSLMFESKKTLNALASKFKK